MQKNKSKKKNFIFYFILINFVSNVYIITIFSFCKGTLIPNSSLQEELSKMDIQLRVDSGATEIINLCPNSQRIQDFFLLLSVCNTVVVAKHPHRDQVSKNCILLVT